MMHCHDRVSESGAGHRDTDVVIGSDSMALVRQSVRQKCSCCARDEKHYPFRRCCASKCVRDGS